MFTILACLALLASSVFAYVPPSQEAALRAFHSSCNGAHWTFQNNWFNGSPCTSARRSWIGLNCRCDGGGFGSNCTVAVVRMPGNNVQCDLSALSVLADLPDLEHIGLQSNSISGQLTGQTWLTSLPKLNHLDLSFNKLTGCVPASFNNMIQQGQCNLAQGNQLDGPCA